MSKAEDKVKALLGENAELVFESEGVIKGRRVGSKVDIEVYLLDEYIDIYVYPGDTDIRLSFKGDYALGNNIMQTLREYLG